MQEHAALRGATLGLENAVLARIAYALFDEGLRFVTRASSLCCALRFATGCKEFNVILYSINI
jgi:hypothetical protein